MRPKDLDWQNPSRATNGLWVAKTALGDYVVGFDDGWHATLVARPPLHWEWEPENDPRSYSGPWDAQRACQAHYNSVVYSLTERSRVVARLGGIHGVSLLHNIEAYTPEAQKQFANGAALVQESHP